jgi:anaerobic magnesium-protoporphyrin IX monomethyl ester cyclase
LSAVSSQFPIIERVAALVKELDLDIFVILGGHHASLSPDQAIECPNLDAIYVSEGDSAVVQLASQLEEGKRPTGIPHLWIRHPETREIEKNPTAPLNEDLDTIPHVDRTLWEPWVANPHEEASILVGRGCLYKCTYRSNHAMEELAEGRYVRYRSSEDMILEIDSLSQQYPRMKHIYLEIETVGADVLKGIDLFEKLADYNNKREEKFSFRINMALHSNFVRSEEKFKKFLELCQKANVTALNVGLQSGSKRVRRQILKRPRYTNEELIGFCRMAREFGVATFLFVLMGVPGETFEDYLETVEVVRDLQVEQGVIPVVGPSRFPEMESSIRISLFLVPFI